MVSLVSDIDSNFKCLDLLISLLMYDSFRICRVVV